MAWYNSVQSFAWIFPVGRGNAAFLRTALNQGFIIDMAGGEFVDPARFIRRHFLPHLDEYKSRKIAQSVLSHPHADHIAQCGELEEDDLSSALHTCPHDKADGEQVDWTRICNPKGSEKVVETYRRLFKTRSPPLQTILYESNRIVPNLEYGLYWVNPRTCDSIHPCDDNKYGNATSIALYLRQGDHSIFLPGDLTPEAIDVLLDESEGISKRFTRFGDGSKERWHDTTGDQPPLRDLLGDHGLTVLVAPHHGLESCYSESLYAAIRGNKPRLAVISERRRAHENDGKTDARYTNGSGGSGVRITVDGTVSERTYLTTKTGHHILCVFSGNGQPRIMANTDPNELLSVLNNL